MLQLSELFPKGKLNYFYREGQGKTETSEIVKKTLNNCFLDFCIYFLLREVLCTCVLCCLAGSN